MSRGRFRQCVQSFSNEQLPYDMVDREEKIAEEGTKQEVLAKEQGVENTPFPPNETRKETPPKENNLHSTRSRLKPSRPMLGRSQAPRTAKYQYTPQSHYYKHTTRKEAYIGKPEEQHQRQTRLQQKQLRPVGVSVGELSHTNRWGNIRTSKAIYGQIF